MIFSSVFENFVVLLRFSLESIDDSYPKIVVTMEDIARKNRNGIQNIQAWNLEDYLARLS